MQKKANCELKTHSPRAYYAQGTLSWEQSKMEMNHFLTAPLQPIEVIAVDELFSLRCQGCGVLERHGQALV